MGFREDFAGILPLLGSTRVVVVEGVQVVVLVVPGERGKLHAEVKPVESHVGRIVKREGEPASGPAACTAQRRKWDIEQHIPSHGTPTLPDHPIRGRFPQLLP